MAKLSNAGRVLAILESTAATLHLAVDALERNPIDSHALGSLKAVELLFDEAVELLTDDDETNDQGLIDVTGDERMTPADIRQAADALIGDKQDV